MSITEGTFAKLNASKNAVKVPAEYGGGRQAFVEVIHELHCLVSLTSKSWLDSTLAVCFWLPLCFRLRKAVLLTSFEFRSIYGGILIQITTLKLQRRSEGMTSLGMHIWVLPLSPPVLYFFYFISNKS
jgi:hypothetical protein